MNNDKANSSEPENSILASGEIKPEDLELVKTIIQFAVDGLKANDAEGVVVKAAREVAAYRKAANAEVFNFLDGALVMRPDLIEDNVTWGGVGLWLKVGKRTMELV